MSRSTTQLKIISNQAYADTRTIGKRSSIGRILLSQNLVTEGDLLKAWSIQRYEAAPIGEILVGMGKLTIDQLYWALGKQYGLELVNLEALPPSLTCAGFSDPQITLKHGYVVWKYTEKHLTIAITDPNNIPIVSEMHMHAGKPLDFVLVKPSCLHKFVASSQGKALEEQAMICCPKSMSCRGGNGSIKARIYVLSVLMLMAIGIILYPTILLTMALSCVFVSLVLLMGFRLACLLAMRKKPSLEQTKDTKTKITKRPKVSILVPLFKEGAIMERLLERLQAIAYPEELLEICFIYEENDPETKAALNALALPWYMKTVEVPFGLLQTKPRAMNYALDFCSGSIIGIYDAEDAPEINQIEQVARKFATADEDVACVQCILDFYNAKTNWISRCFTMEYAILFRIILPALDRMKLPIPLGGTSVFFRRDILEKLGRWDAHNVTEDADLGYRLYRMGYRCSWINAVTYEEANYRPIPWIKQRSRWLKGFLLTALVHFKNPIGLRKKIGISAVLSMLSLTVIPWLLCPLVPVILPMWLLSFGFDLPIYSSLPKGFIYTLICLFIATELMSIYLGFKATNTPRHKHLRPWILTTILYWPISCLASYKAWFEITLCPAYWDKSEHGLNDQLYTEEIEELTTSSEHTSCKLTG